MEMMARFVLNTFIGSLLTFYFSFLLVLIFSRFIKSPRALYLLFLLPFIKITTDLLFSTHTGWIIHHGEAILKKPENSRFLSALVGYQGTYPFLSLKLHLQNGHLFSLGDIFSEVVGGPLTLTIVLLLIVITLLSLFRFGTVLRKSFLWKKTLLKESTFYDSYKKMPIFKTTRNLQSPILIGIWKPVIVCPDPLLRAFTSEEKEAIFSHEIGHVKWRDNLINGLVLGVCSLFWFIPFKRKILEKSYFYREIGCDLRENSLHIATALQKSRTMSLPIGCIAFSSSYNRTKWILEKKGPSKIKIILSFLILFGGATFIFLSHFLPF